MVRTKDGPPPRKKSCNKCASAKVRCDLVKPRCSRCQARKLQCTYVKGSGTAEHADRPSIVEGITPPTSKNSESVEDSTICRTSPCSSTYTQLHSAARPEVSLDSRSTATNRPGDSIRIIEDEKDDLSTLSFDSIDLVPLVDEQRVRSRWMDVILTPQNQREKKLDVQTVRFVSRVFTTYPRMIQENRTPPFIHLSQIAGPIISTPLANCINLIRMWQNHAPGSENMVRQTLEQEMIRLFEQRNNCSQIEMLATLQAYLLYSMMAWFHPDYGSAFINLEVMIKLQELTADVVSSGLICPSEICNTRPDWESWIIAAAKRRTLVAAYMFDNIVSYQTGTPFYIADELALMPLPASKMLWEARNREVWKAAYAIHLNLWPDGEAVISETWRNPDGNQAARQSRVDRWLASVDEFGMMLFATTSATHGG